MSDLSLDCKAEVRLRVVSNLGNLVDHAAPLEDNDGNNEGKLY